MAMQFDIRSENFDLYFYRQVEGAPKEKRELLPKEMAAVLWTNNGAISKKSLHRFNIFHRLFILNKITGKDITITVSDPNGVSLKEWDEFKKKKDYSIGSGEQLYVDATFVLGNKETTDTLNYLNHLSHSPAYKYATRLKNDIPNKSVEYNKQMKYMACVFAGWEANKKSWQNEFNVNLSELYVLLALYTNGEMVGARIYQQMFRRTYHAGAGKIKAAFGTLQSKYMIERLGIKRIATLRITSLGIETVHQIIRKYGLNCLTAA